MTFILGVGIVLISLIVFSIALVKMIFQGIQVMQGYVPSWRENLELYVWFAVGWVLFVFGVFISQL